MFELFKVVVPAFKGLCMCTEAMFQIPRSSFCLIKKGLGFRNLESQAKNIYFPKERVVHPKAQDINPNPKHMQGMSSPNTLNAQSLKLQTPKFSTPKT